MYQAPEFSNQYPLMNFFARLNAAGITPYLPTQTQMKCRRYPGTEYKRIYDNIGLQDPMIRVAPNPFAYGSVPREMYLSSQERMFRSLSNIDYYQSYNLDLSLSKHFPEFSPDCEECESIYSMIYQNDKINPILSSNWSYQREFDKYLESIATGINDRETGISYDSPFKNSPLKNQLAQYLKEKFLTITPEPNGKGYINTGFLGMGASIGARYDHKRIEQLIKEITPPEKLGIPLDDEVALRNYLKSTKFYKELSATNRYVGTIVTMNQMLNMGSVLRTNQFITPDGPMAKCAQQVMSCRKKNFDISSYRKFMTTLSDLTVMSTKISSLDETITKQDEAKLINACNELANCKSI